MERHEANILCDVKETGVCWCFNLVTYSQELQQQWLKKI